MQCSGAAHATPGAPYFTEFIEGRRGEILDAALAVFADKGYECGTMREIAAELGVTEPALYRHYAGKEALFADLVAAAGDRVVGRAAIIIDALDTARVRESLLGLISARRTHVPHDDSTKPVMQMLFTAAPHNGAFREVIRAHLSGPMLERLRAFIPRVDAHYGIGRSPEETTASLRIFMSLLVGYVMTGMMLDVPDDDEGVVDAIIAIMGWDAPAA